MTSAEKDHLTRLGGMLIERDRAKRREKAKRLARRQRVEVFTEKEGKAMFDSLPGRSRPRFGDNGKIVLESDIIGRAVCKPAAWTDSAIAVASQSAEDVLRFILSAGPMTPRAISRRAAVAASLLGLISLERAARIARSHPSSLSRSRQNAKRFLTRGCR